MTRRTYRLTVFALAFGFPLAACEQTVTAADPARDSALEASGAAAAALAETTILLSEDGSAGASFSRSLVDGMAASGGPAVSLGDVKSIVVKVGKVEVLRADSAKLREDSVITLKVTGGSKIDLLALPTKAADGLQLAKGTLPAGTYSNLRLVLDSASITFKTDVSSKGGPNATTYRKDTAYPVTIPGGELRVPTGSFTVSRDAGATVSVAFSGSETVKKVVVTPKEIEVTPVLTAKGTSKGRK